MRLVVLLLLAACGRGEAPAPAPPPAPRLALPRADAAAAVPLGKATPLAVVVVGAKGALAIGSWDGSMPVSTEPMTDVAAIESAIMTRAKQRGDIEQRAAVKWTQDEPALREWRDEVGEREQEAHFTIKRTYFGHFPAGLDAQRTDENQKPPWGEVGRLAIARAETADRVPPLAPLIASAPEAPALPTVRVAKAIGGAIGVSLDGTPGVLRHGFRWAIDVPSTHDAGETWIEIRAAASGLDIIDLRTKDVRTLAWDALGTLVGALGTPTPELVDVLVAPDLTAQQLVDTLASLRSVRWVNLGEAPAGSAAERLAQLRAVRLAQRMEDRVTISKFFVDGHMGDEADAVDKAFATELPALRACYDARRSQMAEPEGFVGVVFSLGPGRKVTKLRVDNDDAQLATCMRDVIAKLAFSSVKARQDVSGTFELKAPERHE